MKRSRQMSVGGAVWYENPQEPFTRHSVRITHFPCDWTLGQLCEYLEKGCHGLVQGMVTITSGGVTKEPPEYCFEERRPRLP